MTNDEKNFSLQELNYLKEKTELCRSASILLKTIAGVIIFTSVTIVIGGLIALIFIF